MSTETFAIIGGDLRFAYLAGQLADDGCKVITAGLDDTSLPPCVTGCSHAAQAISLADCVILPMPVSTDGRWLNAPLSRLPIPLETIYDALCRGQLVVGGALSDRITEELKSRDARVFDYLQREELAIHNAVPTAEGALQLAMEELPITVSGSRCLITGYGRIGQALSRLLIGLGAEVTVVARSCAGRARADTQGCRAAGLELLSLPPAYDVIFNTVPSLLFDRAVLSRTESSTLLIDLASRPGGIDFNAAADYGIKTIWALSLPGRVAPKTAGQIIKTTVLNILREVTP